MVSRRNPAALGDELLLAQKMASHCGNIDTLLADPAKNHKHTLKTAQKFLTGLMDLFGIPASYVLPAREDSPYYLWKEQRLPIEAIYSKRTCTKHPSANACRN